MSLLPKFRVVVALVGLALFAAFIWFAGPLLAFASHSPLAPQRARIAVILAAVGCWLAVQLRGRQRANRASDQLASAVVKQSLAEQPAPEVARLREDFEAAVATLKRKRRDGHTLYELPWYVMIGAPGSGKTTVLANSGLRFPLEQRWGREPLRGVGGTRNCNWWFTDEAIFLDTAGRYTTQESDAAADSAGWAEFLSLLRKHRPRRPLNGVIVAISAEDLMVEGAREREVHVDALRRRLDEVNRELRIQLPMYLLITKCDLLAGFTEYFDDLTQESRGQVWGVTFSYQHTIAGEGVLSFPAEFDALVTRLNERLLPRIAEERDRRRRPRIFGFPHQIAALRDALTEFVTAIFSSTRFDRPVLLRGVYFTSGTQERTPIDRVLGSMSRRFGVAPEVLAPPPGKGKAYFIDRVLKDVVIGESGLAGCNRRIEARQAAAKLGVYAALAIFAVLAVSALWISYGNNRTFIAEVEAATAALDAVPRSPSGAPVDRVLPRLDAIRRVSDSANRYRRDRPWLTMGWGLYEGNSIGNAARDAYARELNGALLWTLKERFEARLREYGADPEKVFEYLKGYLMLESPERLNAAHVGFLADLEWRSIHRSDENAAGRLSAHFRALLDQEGGLRPITLDARLVAQARRNIPSESIPLLMYTGVKQTYANDRRGLPLDEAAGIGAERVFRRKSGVSLSSPVPAIYTKAAFQEITTRSADDLVAQFTADQWVWGEERPSLMASATLRQEFIKVYEDDYIKTWDAVLADLELVPLGTLDKTKEALATIGGETSPLRTFLKTVDDNTNLVKPADAVQESEATKGRLTRIFDTAKNPSVVAPVRPGLRITQHFAPIRQLLAGDGGTAKLEGVLEQLRELHQKLEAVGRGVGQTAHDPKVMAEIRLNADALKRTTPALPPFVGGLVRDLRNRTALLFELGLRTTLEERYRLDVVSACRALASDRHPFFPGGSDLPLADFGKLFGDGGIFDSFFRNELIDLVEKTEQGWEWKPGVQGVAVPLGQFRAAEEIRRMFFQHGASMPSLTFAIAPTGLDDRSKRFILELDGQVVEYAHGPERSVTLKWPGEKVGAAVGTFEESAGARSTIVFDGPWAWFRLMEAAQVDRESEVRYSLTLASGGHRARLRLDASSVWNPFGQRDQLREFHC
jgi:type VI secretion system protein ImpL